MVTAEISRSNGRTVGQGDHFSTTTKCISKSFVVYKPLQDLEFEFLNGKSRISIQRSDVLTFSRRTLEAIRQ